MKYTKRATVTLKEAGLKHTSIAYGNFGRNYADLETTKSPKRYYDHVMIQYLYYNKPQGALAVSDQEQSDSMTLYSFVTLHNRRVILQKGEGYDRYRRML